MAHKLKYGLFVNNISIQRILLVWASKSRKVGNFNLIDIEEGPKKRQILYL